jgi:hypothetical protein
LRVKIDHPVEVLTEWQAYWHGMPDQGFKNLAEILRDRQKKNLITRSYELKIAGSNVGTFTQGSDISSISTVPR